MSLIRSALLRWRMPPVARLRHIRARHLHSTIPQKVRVLFFGSDAFSCVSLRALLANMSGDPAHRVVDGVAVVCLPSVKMEATKKTAPPLPVRVLAARQALSVFEAPPASDKQWSTWCNNLPPFDVGVVVSFGRLIPTAVLRRFPLGMINLHPSLLPRHRGAAPIQHTILAGDTETGVSIMELSEGKFDHGNILRQTAVPIENKDSVTFSALSEQLAELGAASLMEVLADLPKARAHSKPQDAFGREATQARKIPRDAGRVDFARHTALDVDRMRRAFGDQMGIYVYLTEPQMELRITDTAGTTQETPRNIDSSNIQPGDAIYHVPSKTIFIRFKDSAWLKCSKVTVPTRNPIDAAAFVNMYNLRKGKFHLISAAGGANIT